MVYPASILARLPTNLRSIVLDYAHSNKERFKDVLFQIKTINHNHNSCSKCLNYQCFECKRGEIGPNGMVCDPYINECSRCLLRFCANCCSSRQDETNVHTSFWCFCNYCSMLICRNCHHQCNCNYKYFDGVCKGCIRPKNDYFDRAVHTDIEDDEECRIVATKRIKLK